jgi:hypothetical protein
MILRLNGAEGELTITSIIKNNPNKEYVKRVQDYSEKMTMHMAGLHLDKYLSKLDYFESDRLLELRQKYSPSNEDFFARLHRPIDKIWTADGGSANYYVGDNAKKAKLLAILKDVKDGYSIRKWIETFWLLPAHYDPMGMIYMEIDHAGNTYPTYKSCHDVFDYPVPSGRKFEYIVFKCDDRISKEKKDPGKQNDIYYRVVDDAKDYLIKWDGNRATIVKDETFKNYYGQVPAITNGNIFDPITKSFISPDDDVIGIADQHLRDRSVLTMFKLHHGFPLKWMFQADCPTCNGTKKVAGNNCQSCNGSGKKSKYDVSETVLVPFPKAGDPMPKDFAGYYTPPVESWDKMDETIDNEYKDAHYTLWGTHQIEDSDSSQPATATGRFIDVQPVNDKLNKQSDAAEFVETWITDMIGSYTFKSYEGSEINYGRRYLIETPDVIWTKYQDARVKGAPTSSLTFLYIQWLQSEFRSNSVELGKQLKLMKLDIFFHVAISQAKAVITNPDDYIKKLYFEEWVNQLQPDDLVTKTLETLRGLRDEYFKKIIALQPEPAPDKLAVAA